MNPLPSIARRGLVAAAAALALSPALASADSIVYVKDANVWLASGDGGSQYQVTTDGTAAQPYRSPSQADDGTIAVSKGTEILRMKQNGSILNRLDPPMLMNSVSHPMDGVPVDVAISPDGTKVAYSFYGYECPVGASCGARTTTGIIPSDRFAATAEYGQSYFRSPSWVTNTRIFNSGGYGSHINIQDLNTEPFNWVTDQQTDLGDAEVTRAGDKLVAVRGYNDSTHIVWYAVKGNVLSGPKPAERPRRSARPASRPASTSRPGRRTATRSPGASRTASGSTATPRAARPSSRSSCCPGGSEADWGPANVNPGPRETTGGGGPSGGGGPAGGGGHDGRRRPALVHAEAGRGQAARHRPRA